MERVECIVVGGGLAGLSAAYGLARAGHEVMLLERGDYSGSKNVTGGRIYVEPLRDIYPELWGEAPLERAVDHELLTMVGDGSQVTMDLVSDSFVGEHPRSYTVLRAKLDQWFAERATEQGAMVLANMKVDALLRERPSTGHPGRVVGIRAGEDEIAADVVIVAEGVLGLLASSAGLRPQAEVAEHAVGYKEVIELPPQVIEDRWHLEEGHGAAQLFVGALTRNMLGGGFIYTNKDSVSLGLVIGMDQLRARQDDLASWQLLDEFKQLPAVRSLVAGGEVLEYSAHAIAEGGISQVPPLSGDGYMLVGDVAGLTLNALFTVRGMDFAVASGYYAAMAATRALEAKDTSAAALAAYDLQLRRSFVLRELEAAKGFPAFMNNARLFDHYPRAFCQLLTDVYTVGNEPVTKPSKRVFKAVRRDFAHLATLGDLWSLRKV